MRDKQQEPCIFDIFGTEIYDGGEYYLADDGAIAALGRSENFDPNNAVIGDIVQNVGTNFILEALGYEKRTFEANRSFGG